MADTMIEALSSLAMEYSVYLYRDASLVYHTHMEKPGTALDTSFWVVGHRGDVLTYLFGFSRCVCRRQSAPKC